MKTYSVTTLPGDGIGPEVMQSAVAVLQCTAAHFGFALDMQEALLGGCAIDATGNPLPSETLERCLASDAVLLGAVGGPRWDKGGPRPEQGLLGIRAGLNLYANLRPVKMWNALRSASPLREEILGEGLDIMIVRELTGGMYFGDNGRDEMDGVPGAYDTEHYNRDEVQRIARVGFELAHKRAGRLCSVDKANVLESSRFWREQVVLLSGEHPGVALSHMYVDNAAMQLIRNPGQFDVIVTSNMFGDILSDEASMLTGSIGMLPSASLGGGALGLYEPIHGSAPDIAGQGVANPLAMILSAAMLLRHSFGEEDAACAIERAVGAALDGGARTRDLGGAMTTAQMEAEVLRQMAS